MKVLLNTLAFLILSLNIAKTQNMDKTLQKMIEHNLIDSTQVKNISKLLDENGTKSKIAYLNTLLQLEFEKIGGRDVLMAGTISFNFKKPIPEEQRKINKFLLEYLTRLKACELIDEEMYVYFVPKIYGNNFFHPIQLLSNIIEYSENKAKTSPDKLKSLAEKLKRKGIISTNYDKLIKDIEQQKLKNFLDYLNYCNKAIIINPQEFPEEFEKYLELIHQKTASIMPELNFSDFKFKTVIDSIDNYKSCHFVVSITANGKEYRYKSLSSVFDTKSNKNYDKKIDKQEFYKIFNKILIDLQSPYRLHEVESYQADANNQVFGIIALTKEQANLLRESTELLKVSYEYFNNFLTSEKIEEVIKGCKAIGLLSHLTSEQIENKKNEIAEEEIISMKNVLMSFPDIILSFDTEMENLEDPYAELVRELRKISHNDFDAKDISDNFNLLDEDADKVIVKFKIKNKKYSKTLKIQDDWLDLDFFDFIDDVTIENKLKGRFYNIYSEGQSGEFIYLTEEQYQYLKTNTVLFFDGDTPLDED